MGLRLAREQLRDEAAEAERIQAKGRPHPVVAGGRRVTLVEDEVDHLKHRPEPGLEVARRGDLERNVRSGQGPFRADDPLRDGRLGYEEGAPDLVRREASEQPKRQCHARLGRQHRVTCNEDETKEIVTEITAAFRNRRRHLLRSLQLASDHLLLPLEPRVSAQSVDGAMFGCRHEPGARVVRNA